MLGDGQRHYPSTPDQKNVVLTDRERDLANLRRLIQRVEAAAATPEPTSPLSLETHIGLFPHYGDDTRTIRSTVETPDNWLRIDIHLTTSFGKEGIVAMSHERKGSEGTMQWLDGAAAITRFGEGLDRHNVPQLPENL